MSGPGRCKVFEKACGERGEEGGWERVISCVIFTRNHRISAQSGKCAANVIKIRLFSPLSHLDFSHFSSLLQHL